MFGLIHLTKKGLQLQENNNYKSKNNARKAENRAKLFSGCGVFEFGTTKHKSIYRQRGGFQHGASWLKTSAQTTRTGFRLHNVSLFQKNITESDGAWQYVKMVLKLTSKLKWWSLDHLSISISLWTAVSVFSSSKTSTCREHRPQTNREQKSWLLVKTLNFCMSWIGNIYLPFHGNHKFDERVIELATNCWFLFLV